MVAATAGVAASAPLRAAQLLVAATAVDRHIAEFATGKKITLDSMCPLKKDSLS
jgi:hypothetical protein